MRFRIIGKKGGMYAIEKLTTDDILCGKVWEHIDNDYDMEIANKKLDKIIEEYKKDLTHVGKVYKEVIV